MAGIWEMLFGSPDKMNQQSLLNRGQENYLNSTLNNLNQLGGSGGGMQNAMQLLQGLLNPQSDVYKNFEAPYMQQFEQQTVPMLAERFAGLGGGMGGGLSNSGFGQALSAAGGNLQTQLAAMKSGMQRNAANDIMGQYNQMGNQALGTRAFENTYQPGSTGLVGQGVQGFMGGLGSGVGFGGNPLAAFANLFSQNSAGGRAPGAR